jgi:mersacidin/lichenicidin family type 2 lantibiotic
MVINMSRDDIIRAWKDAEFRKKLSSKKRALLPDNPAGYIELKDEDLGAVVGGESLPACTGYITTCDAQCFTEVGTCETCTGCGATCQGETCGGHTCGTTCPSTAFPCEPC